MILKKSRVELHLKLNNTKSNIGLKEGDYWYQTKFLIKDNQQEISLSENTLSQEELNELVNELTKLKNSQKTYSKRITFIKNYFIFYLQALKNNQKIVKIKLINIDNKHTNYTIELKNEEIRGLIDLLTP